MSGPQGVNKRKRKDPFIDQLDSVVAKRKKKNRHVGRLINNIENNRTHIEGNVERASEMSRLRHKRIGIEEGSRRHESNRRRTTQHRTPEVNYDEFGAELAERARRMLSGGNIKGNITGNVGLPVKGQWDNPKAKDPNASLRDRIPWSDLPPWSKELYDKPITNIHPYDHYKLALTRFPNWEDYQREQREAGIQPSEEQYRLLRMEKLIEQRLQTTKNQEGYDGIGGFFKGAWESFTQVAPGALADVANVIGRVLPGSSLITDKIEDALNPEGKKHSWEELGGPWENVINGAVGAAGKLTAGGLVMRHKRPRRKVSMYSVKKYN